MEEQPSSSNLNVWFTPLAMDLGNGREVVKVEENKKTSFEGASLQQQSQQIPDRILTKHPEECWEDVPEEHNCCRAAKSEAPIVKRRVKALLKNQLAITTLSAELAKQVQAMEFEFAERMKHLEEVRQSIVSGLYEPTDEECDISEVVGIDEDNRLDETSIDLLNTLQQMAIDDDEGENNDCNSSEYPGIIGIPSFWGQVLQGCSAFASLIEDDDYMILKYLKNITLHPFNNRDVQGYKLRFHFGRIPYFTNEILSKTFFTSSKVKEDTPLSLIEEPWPINSVGTSIKWINGKNPTIKKIIQPKQKMRNGPGGVENWVEKHSFFKFFKSVSLQNKEGTRLEESKIELQEHYEFGEFIRKKIIPSAALYYYNPEDVCETDSEDDGDEVADDVPITIIAVKRARNGRIITDHP